MDINYDVITLFQNTFILRRSGVTIFADIIKLKTIFKDSRKVKKIFESKCSLCIYFLIQQNLLISVEKLLMSAELIECHVNHNFSDLFQVRYNCAKFHHCKICVTDFRKGEPFWPTPSVKSSEKAHPEQGSIAQDDSLEQSLTTSKS